VDSPRNLQQGDGGSHYNDEGEYDRDVAVFVHGRIPCAVARTFVFRIGCVGDGQDGKARLEDLDCTIAEACSGIRA
jgi:hypothetical protein